MSVVKDLVCFLQEVTSSYLITAISARGNDVEENKTNIIKIYLEHQEHQEDQGLVCVLYIHGCC